MVLVLGSKASLLSKGTLSPLLGSMELEEGSILVLEEDSILVLVLGNSYQRCCYQQLETLGLQLESLQS
jgi:hypothetical protein